jgi:phospholipase/carboxylesterase
MAELDGPRWGPAQPPVQQLVVLCHGVGADGHDVIDLGPTWSKALPNAVFAAPDGPEPCDMAPGGRQWFSLLDRSPPKMLSGVSTAADALDGFINAELNRLGLPPDAYALMGFSQGAMTALHTGLRRVVPPRAILAFSGALLPPASMPNRPPVLLIHGEADPTVPVERSRQAEAALRAAGMQVETLYVPRLAHGIDDGGLTAGALFLQKAFSAA